MVSNARGRRKLSLPKFKSFLSLLKTDLQGLQRVVAAVKSLDVGGRVSGVGEKGAHLIKLLKKAFTAGK